MLENKKIENKKAVAMKALVFLVMAVIVVVLLITFNSRTKELMKGKSAQQVCKESVKMHSAAMVKGVELTSDIYCPTQYVTIEKDKTPDNEKIKQELAEYMKSCWDMFHEGTLQLFDSSLLEKRNYCVICYHITIKDKDKIPMKEFIDFLDKNKAVFEVDGELKEMSYSAYLSNRYSEPAGKERNYEQGFSKYTPVIDPSSPYAVVFVQTRKGALSDLFYELTGGSTVAGALIGAGIALLAGVSLPVTAALGGLAVGVSGGYISTKIGGVEQDWNSYIFLWPYKTEELLDLKCYYLPARQDIKET